MLFNLIIQLFLGVALELVHSYWRVTLVYLSGVLAGSIATSFFKPTTGLIGASGGVYSLITAHLASVILNWHEMESAKIQLFVFLILCSSNIGTEIYQSHINPNNNIGHIAHVSGAISGLLVGIGVLRNLNVRPYEKKIWWLAVSIYFSLMVSGVLCIIFGKSFENFNSVVH